MLKMKKFILVSLVIVAWSSSFCDAKSVEFSESYDQYLKSLSKKFIDITGLCIAQDDCYTKIFKFDNLCCQGRCCNYFDFVFNQPDQSVVKNFLLALEYPRFVNIFIMIACISGIAICLFILFEFLFEIFCL